MNPLTKPDLTVSDSVVLDAFAMTHKVPRYAPDMSHQCTRMKCKMWEYRVPFKGPRQRHCAPVFVCVSSRQVHRCGEMCEYREHTTEGYVCCLTGIVLGSRQEHHESMKTDFWGRRVTSTHSRSHGGQSRRPSKQSTEAQRMQEWTLSSVRILFCSDARRRFHKSRMSRLVSDATVSAAPYNFVDVTHAMMCRVRRSPVTFNAPCDRNDPRIARLADQICRYALKFNKLQRNRKTVYAFVSACVEKLRCGYNIGDTEMFPKDPFVARHAPDELSHGPLGAMRCRYMSSATLLISQGITSEAGLPLRNMRFV